LLTETRIAADNKYHTAMKKKVYIALAVFLLIQTFQLSAAEKLIAYPVPFDPANTTLSLKYQPPRTVNPVQIEIFDVNGDRIFSRKYANIDDFHWKGFSDDGKKISNGLYIVKVRWEDALTGQIITDAVRVTVVRRKK
jgi:hypothetical protein